MEGENQAIADKESENVNNKGKSAHNKDAGSSELEPEDDFPKKVNSEAEMDPTSAEKRENMNCRNEAISSIPLMEEHIHLCHERIMEYDNEQKRLESIVVVLGKTLSNVINTLQVFQGEAEFANQNVGELLSGVKNAFKVLNRINVKDEAVDYNSTLLQVENEDKCGNVMLMEDSIESSMKLYSSQQSSIDLLQTTLEISEEHLSGFLAKFWLKIGAVINAVNNPENKMKNFSPKEMSNLQASLESDISELCMYLKKKCELLKQIKSSLNDSEFQRSLSGLENKFSIKSLHMDMKEDPQQSPFENQKSEFINVKDQTDFIIRQLSDRKNNSHKFVKYFNNEPMMRLEEIIVNSSECMEKCQWSGKVIQPKSKESGIELDGVNLVTIPLVDLDKIHKESGKWKKACHSLKNVVIDLMEHINSCEEALNSTLVQSILRMSGVNEESDFVSGKSSGEKIPRKVHFTPSVLTKILPSQELQNEEDENLVTQLEESSEDIHKDLQNSLERLRREANALLSLSGCLKQKEEDFGDQSHLELMHKISLLENQLKTETMEKDKLKVELHELKALHEGQSSTEDALLARAIKAESQLAELLLKKGNAQENVELITEGIGEGNGHSNFDKLQYKLTQLKEKARGALKQHHKQGENRSSSDEIKADSSMFHFVEVLCCEVDRLFEDAKRENEDLQLQVESADKQLRSTRAFLEEQTIEREQEREEFQKELNHLCEALSGRDRDREEKERAMREVESLEQKCKQMIDLVRDANTKKDEDEAELKAAVEKIWDLRDIIRELETQVENAHQVEQDLRSQNENLILEVAIHKKKLDDLLEELESLCSSLVFNPPSEIENKNHTTLLKEAIRNHCVQVEQAKALASSFKDFKKQLVALGTAIDMKTKELEALQVTPVIVANCNSPSEDVSVREQLEQATWRSESPLEDDLSRRDLSGNNSEIDVECMTTFALPKVPFAELCHLQEKLTRYSQAQEPLLKRMHDLEMQIQSLKQGEEELITEREVLQSQVEEQLLQASELQARLDEARQRGGQHIHCLSAMSASSNSPHGSPSIKADLPSFCCTALAEARHEVENLTECIEKKELEVTQLRRALEDSKKVVALQEKQLTDRAKEEAEHLEKLKDYEHLKENVHSLQMKLSKKVNIDNEVVPFSFLLDQLLTEKNEEIEMLRQKILNLQSQLLRISTDEGKASQNSSPLTEHNLSKDEKDTSGYMDKSSSGSQDEVEVLRDHEMGRSSFEQLGGDMYLKEQEPFPKLWLHSTKVDVQNSALDTSGLTFSPVNNPKNEQSVIIEEPDLEEESLQKLPSSALSYSSNNSKDKSQLNSEDHGNSSKGSSQVKIYKDFGAQVSEENITEDLRLIILNKEGEIETLKKKVDELSENRDLLNQVIIELREKVEWHSKHLEKYEEESLGREALIAQVQMEKNDLESALKLAEQEVNSWKSSHDKIKEKVKSQEEQIENLKAKVDRYCKANKEQHLLLKTAQQERKQIISILTNLGTGGNKDNENVNLQISSPSSSLKTLVTNLVDQLQSLSIEVSNLKSVRNQPKEDLEKEPELLATNSVKEPPGNVYEEVEIQESRFVNPIHEKLVPNSIQAVRGSSPSLVSLEQMMEKVQQEGMEVLNLSELAVGKRATPIDTPISVSPFDSPKSGHSLNAGQVHSSADSLKTKQMFFPEDERAQLLLQIQALENELSAKEREELRRRDWLEFQEKEGLAGWCGMIETIGQKQRHELNILEQLGQQRNARAKLEASMSHLQQQLSQAETELRKVTSRLGMERSHVIRLESALQQEKSNFSQLQQSLDLERKRANMMKELNLKVSETLQSELVQCQSKCMYLLESLKEEHELRMELEAQLKRIQREQEYAGESAERDNLGLDAIPTEQSRQLRKIEEECERKALEQELESEKHRRSQYQKELLQLRGLLESRSKQEMYDACRRWSSSGFPPGTDTSFNAEDMLQNLKGINQVLGWHVRSRDDKQRPVLGSVDMEKYFLEAKCHHLEQKLESLMCVMKEHNLWASDNSFAMVDEQPLPKLDGSIHPQLAEELVKFKELVQRLYSLYWRSERNRKALAWQKQYFLSILNASKVVKNDRSLDILKSNDMTGLERLHHFSWQSARKQKSHGSFRVLVWTVIATLRMKVLVLRSIAGIQVGCQSLIENVLPTQSYSRSKH